MDFDLLREVIGKWSEELLQNEQQLSVIGRLAVLTAAALLGSVLTWFSTRLGWACLKGTGRGLRRLWPLRPGDPLVEQLCSAIEASLAQMPQPINPARVKLLFTRGEIDLKTGVIRLNGEKITSLFSRRQYRRLWRLAKGMGRKLQVEADQKHKRGLLAKVLPSPCDQPPCASAPCASAPCGMPPPIIEEPLPGEAAARRRLEAMMCALGKAGWKPTDPLID